MAAKKKTAARKGTSAQTTATEVVAMLERMASKKVRDGMARYGIPAEHALGISVGALRQRSVGARSPALLTASPKLATLLAASSDPTDRWIGKDALRDLSCPAVQKKVATRFARQG